MHTNDDRETNKDIDIYSKVSRRRFAYTASAGAQAIERVASE